MIVKLYEDIATYLAERGYALAAENMRHWLHGGKPDPKIIPAGVFQRDRRTAEVQAQITRCLVAAIELRDCSCYPQDRSHYCAGIGVFPSTTDLVGALGFFKLFGTLVCGGPVPYTGKGVQCYIEFQAVDRYDWNPNHSTPCLPGCAVRIPDNYGNEITKMLTSPTYYNILSEKWYVYISILCPKKATRKKCCPGSDKYPRTPDDWPGPPNCL